MAGEEVPAEQARHETQSGATPPGHDPDAPVLVAVLNRRRDLDIAREEGWYRIPLRRAPRRVAAEYLAFYQTKAFGDEGWSINYYAPVQRFRMLRRDQLLPQEDGHPRAADVYYKVEIGPLQPLPQPIPSRRLRRITFIPTTMGRLLAAQEINDLWWRDDPQERLWLALREAGLLVECRYQVGQLQPRAEVDFALFCRDGRIAVLVDEGRHEAQGQVAEVVREGQGLDYQLTAAGWHVLRFHRRQLEAQLPVCVGAILALVQQLGGQGT
jgi:very-short-patch-repair endonuclease